MGFEFNNIVYLEADIVKSDIILNQDFINKLKPILGDKGECLKNSYKTAQLTNSKCVEGFVFCIIPNESKVIRHCWNVKNGIYFDVTRDYIWDKNEGAKKFQYYIIQEFNHTEYKTTSSECLISFLSNAVVLAKDIDDEYNNDSTA